MHAGKGLIINKRGNEAGTIFNNSKKAGLRYHSKVLL
jgi:hypothetical protein